MTRHQQTAAAANTPPTDSATSTNPPTVRQAWGETPSIPLSTLSQSSTAFSEGKHSYTSSRQFSQNSADLQSLGSPKRSSSGREIPPVGSLSGSLSGRLSDLSLAGRNSLSERSMQPTPQLAASTVSKASSIQDSRSPKVGLDLSGVDPEVVQIAKPFFTGNIQADRDILKFYIARQQLLKSTGMK